MGLALMLMRVVFEGKAPEMLSGTKMCWQTFAIINVK
jgi:hypothetical protein